MRLLFGIILGAGLAIGGAWLIDRNNIGGLDGPLVNWERVDQGWTNVREGARVRLRQITG